MIICLLLVTMADLGEQWASVYQPLQDMKSDGPWTAKRAEFIGKLPDAQDPAIGAFLAYMDAMTDGQRVEAFRTEQADSLLYGYLEQYSDSSSSDEESDASPWEEFVATNAPVWDGEEATWDQFREWFSYYANEAGFGTELAALLAEADAQDIEGRIATFGREGGTVTGKRKRTEGTSTSSSSKKLKETGGGGGDVGTAPRTSGRLAAKKAAAQALGVTLTVNTVSEGTLTQHLDQEDSIGFHMVVTLTIGAGQGAIDTLYSLQQYARDAYDKGADDQQDLTGWEPDGPFGPPYGGDEQDGNVTITQTDIVFDDHPGFSTTSRIDEGVWLHSYQVDFYWVVTRLADGAEWTSPELSNTLDSEYDDGDDAPVNSNPSGAHAWDVTFD